MVRIHNTNTDEVIDREMTDIEFAQYKKDQVAFDAERAKVAAKDKTKQELFDRLGITAEEAALLLS